MYGYRFAHRDAPVACSVSSSGKSIVSDTLQTPFRLPNEIKLQYTQMGLNPLFLPGRDLLRAILLLLQVECSGIVCSAYSGGLGVLLAETKKAISADSRFDRDRGSVVSRANPLHRNRSKKDMRPESLSSSSSLSPFSFSASTSARTAASSASPCC